MVDVVLVAFSFLILCLGLFVLFMYVLGKSIKKDIERQLQEMDGDDRAQVEFKLHIVKAMFPPRFNR